MDRAWLKIHSFSAKKFKLANVSPHHNTIFLARQGIGQIENMSVSLSVSIIKLVCSVGFPPCHGFVRDLNLESLAPKARIIPLYQAWANGGQGAV